MYAQQPTSEAILTWDGPDLPPDELPPECVLRSSLMRLGWTLTSGISYSQARTPTDTVIYTFSPHTSDSMLLLPPRDAPDTRPLYHISASLNLFNPNSGVTTIRRGGRADGEFVSDFECVFLQEYSVRC
jgi:hypothetical protein